jgi:hypothetical protein
VTPSDGVPHDHPGNGERGDDDSYQGYCTHDMLPAASSRATMINEPSNVAPRVPAKRPRRLAMSELSFQRTLSESTWWAANVWATSSRNRDRGSTLGRGAGVRYVRVMTDATMLPASRV